MAAPVLDQAAVEQRFIGRGSFLLITEKGITPANYIKAANIRSFGFGGDAEQTVDGTATDDAVSRNLVTRKPTQEIDLELFVSPEDPGGALLRQYASALEQDVSFFMYVESMPEKSSQTHDTVGREIAFTADIGGMRGAGVDVGGIWSCNLTLRLSTDFWAAMYDPFVSSG